MLSLGDTIVACATPWGRGAIAVVRLSGPDVETIVRSLCRLSAQRTLTPRRAQLVGMYGETKRLDEGLVLWMPGPGSYTGEDIAELSCHGNPLIVEQLIDRCVALGARVAGPGEFTRRAVLNGRMDLPRAEAVCQAIEARSEAGISLAQQGLKGALSERFVAFRSVLETCGAELEVRLDYPGEEPGNWSDEVLCEHLRAFSEESATLAQSYRAGKAWVEGAKIVLLGPVNAGKSTLFNALLGDQRALVSPMAGTTRDIVEARCVLSELPVVLFDTAGERDAPDEIEAAGIALRDGFVRSADLVLHVFPAHVLSRDAFAVWLASASQQEGIVVLNHVDQVVDSAQLEQIEALIREAGLVSVQTNAKTQQGLDVLKAQIKAQLMGEEPGEAALVIGSQRQRDLLSTISRHARSAADAIETSAGIAVAAEEVIHALERIGQLDGREAREGVLDRLFARFCIGK